MARGGEPVDARVRRARTAARVGRELAVDEVEAGASCRRRWGRSARRVSPAATAKRHVVDRGARRRRPWTGPADLEHGGGSSPRTRAQQRAAARRRCPSGTTSTMQQDRRAEHRAPVLGRARERVLQPGERGGAEQRAGERVEPAQQHHHQRVDRARNRQRLGRDAALRERVQAAGEPGEAPGERERQPLRAPDVDAERLGAQRRVARRRAARSRTATARSRRCATSAAPTTRQREPEIGALVGERAGAARCRRGRWSRR